MVPPLQAGPHREMRPLPLRRMLQGGVAGGGAGMQVAWAGRLWKVEEARAGCWGGCVLL